MRFKESEREKDLKWVKEKLRTIEKLKEQEGREKKYSKKVEILKKIIEIYEDLKIADEFDEEKLGKDYEEVKEHLRYCEHVKYYFQNNRVKCYNPETKEIEEIGGSEDWEEER